MSDESRLVRTANVDVPRWVTVSSLGLLAAVGLFAAAWLFLGHPSGWFKDWGQASPAKRVEVYWAGQWVEASRYKVLPDGIEFTRRDNGEMIWAKSNGVIRVRER